MSLDAQDMKAIKDVVNEVVNEVVHDVIAKEVTPRFENLEKKMDRNHAVNIQHHLETRKMIADQSQKNDRFRENLTKAASGI